MNQRNVIASFRDYDDANAAASELSRAGFGDVQIRILPPRTTYGRHHNQQIVVSAIVNASHAHAAENILALNGGAIDLHEDANWGGDRWDDRRGGFRPERNEIRRRDRHEEHGETWMHGLPWGAIAGATVALLTGFAFMRGTKMLGDAERQDYAPGQYRRNSRSFRSVTASSSYPDAGRFAGLASKSPRRSSQIADEADLAWGDHDADDTAPLHDRPAGAGAFQTGTAVRAPSGNVGAAGSSVTQGLRNASGAGANLGAGSAMGSGVGVGSPASHARDQAGTAATRYAHE